MEELKTLTCACSVVLLQLELQHVLEMHASNTLKLRRLLSVQQLINRCSLNVLLGVILPCMAFRFQGFQFIHASLGLDR
jgi:hypothetical protein